jgi:hypothetical protein
MYVPGAALATAAITAHTAEDETQDKEKNAEEEDLGPVAVHGDVFEGLKVAVLPDPLLALQGHRS